MFSLQNALESLQTSTPRSHDSDRGIRAPAQSNHVYDQLLKISGKKLLKSKGKLKD